MADDPAQADLLAKLHAQHRVPDPSLVGKLQKRYTDKNGADRFIELDYLGHAAVTDILLAADPLWSWEPAATDETGRPVVDRDKDGWPRGMWIRLTVLGHTRLGYGTCTAGKQDAIKELIGDALRNAAMRFGVGLSLWAKEEWSEAGGEPQPGEWPHGTSGKEAAKENAPRAGNVTNLPRPSDADVARHPANGPTLPPAQALAARAEALGLTEEEYRRAVATVSSNRTRSAQELTAKEFPQAFKLLESIARDKRKSGA